MDQNPAMESETLLSFLASVPPGEHTSVCLDSLTPEQAIQLCAEAAADLREKLLVASRDLDFRTVRKHDLIALSSAARASGARGLIIVVNGDDALRRDRDGHVGAELALGPKLPHGARIFCIYTRDARAARPEVFDAHGERLDERAWRVP